MGSCSVWVLAHFYFRFCSVLGKTWVLVWLVCAGFGFFAISSIGVEIVDELRHLGDMFVDGDVNAAVIHSG